MNKKYLYPLIIILFIAAMGFIFFKNKKTEEIAYELQERKGPILKKSEFIKTRAKAESLGLLIEENPEDSKSRLALTTIYIQEARITGNYMYYDMAAMQQLNAVLKKEPENFNALTYKALIYLSQHHFADGLAVAEKAKTINPYNAFIYGILIDANVEMGNYKEAVNNAEKMISIRPDLRSYSRISYLREIHGDYPGAIEAMKLAVDAGVAGDEGTEWARVQLGHLFENTGDLKSAEMNYSIALNMRPDYSYALAGMARLATANNDYAKAINYYKKADSLVSDYAFDEELVDVYKLAGQNDKAEMLAKAVIENMNKDSKAGLTNDNIGHYSDRELAHAYLKINDNDKALIHALAEYNRRPENIDVNETVAWVYYNQKDYVKALSYIKQALKTNCKNPVLLCHAGLIYAKAGQKTTAKLLLEQGLKDDPNIPEEIRKASIQAMQAI